VESRRLGGTEVAITPIGLGCMQFSGVGGGRMGRRMYPSVTQEVADEVVGAALDGGIGWFDTAEMYGRGASERALAHALAARGVAPGRVAVATKWLPLGRTARGIGGTIDRRVGALAPYPIDLYQIHVPFGSLARHRAQLAAMARLVEAGTVRAVGVSNFSARQMAAAHRTLAAHGIPLASNQVHISLLHRDIERDGVLDAARELGVTLIAYSPLDSGLLTGRYHAAGAAAPTWRRLGFGVTARRVRRAAPVIDALTGIAHRYGATPAQVALAWLVTFYGDTVVAIPGASKPRQATEAAAAGAIRLDRAELDRLDELSRG
jgi:aryl-alcohol dehydrogenase-like predicted oxidoreductase